MERPAPVVSGIQNQIFYRGLMLGIRAAKKGAGRGRGYHLGRD
jgi:hypothetical protein